VQRQAHIEKQHSPSPPARGGVREDIIGIDGPSASEMGAETHARARSSRGAGGSGANPWTSGGRGDAGDVSLHLVVGGGPVNRVARTVGTTSAR
jgi:hypothetical protein